MTTGESGQNPATIRPGRPISGPEALLHNIQSGQNPARKADAVPLCLTLSHVPLVAGGCQILSFIHVQIHIHIQIHASQENLIKHLLSSESGPEGRFPARKHYCIT